MLSQCPHCQPYNNYIHTDDYLTSGLQSLSEKLASAEPKDTSRAEAVTRWLWPYLLRVLMFLQIAQPEPSPDESKLYNRGLIFFREAQRRGVDIFAVTILGMYVHEYVYYDQNGNFCTFYKLPDPKPKSSGRVDNKVWALSQLESADLPTPDGQSFWSKRAGVKFGKQIGFPLVVKPTHGSLSKHVTTNITSETELKEAITIAKQLSPEYIVQEHLSGKLYRATVIDREHVFVCEKQKPHVTGNGTDTIEQLIEQKNKAEGRKATDQKNATLHVVDKRAADRYLKGSNYTLATVLEDGEKVVVSDLYTLAAGCDIVEKTQEVHPRNKRMLQKAAEKLHLGLVGFDFICPNITKPCSNQECGIIEANTKPYADMHARPSSGQPQPVAEVMWNTILEN